MLYYVEALKDNTSQVHSSFVMLNLLICPCSVSIELNVVIAGEIFTSLPI